MHRLRSRVTGLALALAVAVVVVPALSAPAQAAAPLPAPTVMPNPVRAGERFTVNGEGCASKDPHQLASFDVNVEGSSSGFGEGGSTFNDGSWKAELRVPSSFADGNYRVVSHCQIGTNKQPYPRVSLTVGKQGRPSLTTSEKVIAHGSSVTAEVSGFGAREQVQVVDTKIDATPLVVGTTDRLGTLVARLTIPRAAPLGHQFLEADGLQTGRTARAAIVVIAAPDECQATSCEPTSPPLASTGISTDRFLLIALAMIVLGTAMLTVGLRRAD